MNPHESQGAIKGRGTATNPKNRFEALDVQIDGDYLDSGVDDVPSRPKTRFYRDSSKTILAKNNSPDVPFTHSINPYRGCEHGCAYCYARPTHEYLGFSAGLDFETQIMVKTDAATLLRKELSKRSYIPEVIGMSGVTDCYQPAERHFKITRECLSVLNGYKNPVGIITKNALITRDTDILSDMASWQGVSTVISLTTLDDNLARTLEPRTAQPARRLHAIRQLADAGVPVGVLLAPMIAGLNDHEIPALLEAAHEAGASFASFVVLRLPYGTKDIFNQWLEQHVPTKRDKIIHRLEGMRDGKLNDARFGHRMRGQGIFAAQIKQLFAATAKRLGLDGPWPSLSTEKFQRPGQLSLFN